MSDMPETMDWSERRSDARRNHERVLAAATEVFTELGLDATIPQVAARAGVGKATVYRSYPTKADLVAALAQVHVDWLRAVVATAAEEAKTGRAYEALGDLLEKVMARLAEDRLMGEILSGTEGWDSGQGKAKGQFDFLISTAREQGDLRSDASVTDIQVLVGGCAHALASINAEPDAWRRYARLALAALRP